jgi:hypothetical protein
MIKVRNVLLSLLLLAACGCGALQPQFVDAVDAAWSTIAPRYAAYVQADPTLGAEDKATRLRTATLLTETIKEAQIHE